MNLDLDGLWNGPRQNIIVNSSRHWKKDKNPRSNSSGEPIGIIIKWLVLWLLGKNFLYTRKLRFLVKSEIVSLNAQIEVSRPDFGYCNLEDSNTSFIEVFFHKTNLESQRCNWQIWSPLFDNWCCGELSRELYLQVSIERSFSKFLILFSSEEDLLLVGWSSNSKLGQQKSEISLEALHPLLEGCPF